MVTRPALASAKTRSVKGPVSSGMNSTRPGKSRRITWRIFWASSRGLSWVERKTTVPWPKAKLAKTTLIANHRIPNLLPPGLTPPGLGVTQGPDRPYP